MRTKTEEEMASLIKNSASMDEVKAQQLNEIRKALLDIRDILQEQSKPTIKTYNGGFPGAGGGGSGNGASGIGYKEHLKGGAGTGFNSN